MAGRPETPETSHFLDNGVVMGRIDPFGQITRAHYYRFVGDDLPLAEIFVDGAGRALRFAVVE